MRKKIRARELALNGFEEEKDEKKCKEMKDIKR